MSDRKTIAPMLIEIEDTPVHENPQANVKLFRTKVCPYQLENRVWVVREGRDPLKVADTSLSLSQPAKLGENKFTVNRLLNLIGEHEAPPPGPAYDEVRIGAKCNLVQMLFPNWGPGWIRTDFRFIE
ncbi:MAG: hypothetical protein GY952_14195 [Rhodobacteraceae bacterium]|nr:hypothetical protein [Paracoccaceae bacterium]